jgi:DNA helicase-2/ATP-dependent DNA helicase PcrA
LDRENAVNILTVHSAKGLEFPVVFLVSLTADRFPTRNRKETLPIPDELIKEILPTGDFHFQEERRLFYVGMTRAKDKLYLSAANYYGGGKTKKKLSPFIAEALGEKVVQKALPAFSGATAQLSIFDFKEPVIVSNVKPAENNLNLNFFSFSQIEVFETCPKQFFYRYVLKVPEADVPALNFGSSIHLALELFYRQVKEQSAPTIEQLTELFRNNFIPAGYFSKNQRLKSIKHGEQILQAYYEKFHSEHGEVVSLEDRFSLKLAIKGREYKIVGKIDRIDRHGDLYEIIDYKTGKMPLASELKKSVQLALYALAVMDKNFLGLSQEQIRLTLYYLDKQEKYSVLAKERDLEKTKADILETITTLRQSQFEPKTGKHCDWCPFKILCPAWEN